MSGVHPKNQFNEHLIALRTSQFTIFVFLCIEASL